MLEELKKQVYEANLMLKKDDLVMETWGNASGIDRDSGLMVIKPSGVEYNNLSPDKMVIVDIKSGKKVEGDLNPSSDTFTHIVLYNNFTDIGGIAHTHSKWATIFAQAGMEIKTYGTTHADCFCGDVPCTRKIKKEEIENNYEYNIGKIIVETFKNKNPYDVCSVLVRSHGSFCWGINACEAARHSTILEKVAELNYYTILLNPKTEGIDKELIDKHYFRKHGKDAYYGQNR